HDDIWRVNSLAARDDPVAAITGHEKIFDGTLGEQAHAVRFDCSENRRRQHAAINAGFIRHKRSGANVARERGLERLRFLDAQHLGGKSEPMMQRSERAECSLRVLREESLYCAASLKSCLLSGCFFYVLDELWVEVKARTRERYQRNRVRAIGRG